MASIIPEQDDAPVFERLDTLIKYVSNAIPQNSMKTGGIMRRIAADMTEEIRAFPPEIVEVYIQYFASMLFWVSKGYAPEDFPLPPDFETGQKEIEG